MKKIYTFAAALFCLLAVGCTRDMKSFSSFDLRDVNFTDDESKMHLVFSGSGSALSYDSGVDHVYVNGEDFTIYQREGAWTAEGTAAVEAERFYCAYADGSVFNWNEGDKTYDFSLDLATTNGIVLAGNTDEHTLTLTPCCAVIRVPFGVTGYTVKVGFDANKVPKSAKINAESKQIVAADIAYLTGVTSGGAGQFLNFKEDAEHNYYVGVPMAGNSVTTTLYLEWTKSGNTTKYKTTGQVTLEKGKVYTLGTERVSPFDDGGAGYGEFSINSNDDAVAFSCGNLMSQPRNLIFCFADNQYTIMGDANNSIRPKYTGLIDLFGWGTSGDTYHPGLNSESAADYYSDGNINGTNNDWGVYNSGSAIYTTGAFTTLSSHTWRTLTDAEWAYIFNNHDWGLADINIGGNHYYGIIIKPVDVYNPQTRRWNAWSCDVAFNTGRGSGYSTNSLTEAQWKKLESSGVIFLPNGGYRVGQRAFSYGAEGEGWYWSTTITPTGGMTPNHAKALKFSNSTNPSIANKPRMNGCSVRLVTDVTW